ncbi:MAG: extracellular solute-binding protein [Lachnospiraceae bacterium]|nr:extracellular solute-binding protein [Lachnospiraceae bacterium]
MKKRFLIPALLFLPLLSACGTQKDDDALVLRVCNWEEYIDLGDWDEEETIDLESGDILGENPLYEDFEEWYFETYGQKVRVEYSCFGTNEELYNMLTLGDKFDLVCPSEYMIMKLMSEEQLLPYSAGFRDEEIPENYYVRNVSPFIREKFDGHEIGGHSWSEYAAGYMWGVTGLLYDPEVVDKETVSSWNALLDPSLCRRVTVKDNVRDAYFPAVAAVKAEKLTDPAFTSADDYSERLEEEMNDCSEETVAAALDFLQSAKDNAYSFETDSGKADMVSGKVLANLQWSGDAVYAMDQAEEDELYLAYSVPEECTNLWFDGWVMLKDGIAEEPGKQQAAEAFVNFLSRPDNAVRNMYYIGYTSVISGGTDGDAIYEYLDWTYGTEEEEGVDYNLSWFFDGEGEESGDYVLFTDEEQLDRQLFAQYPTPEVMERSSIMRYFDTEANARINRMWINVRCFNINRLPVAVRAGALVLCIAVLGGLVFLKLKKRA